jgi:hypothetical protein
MKFDDNAFPKSSRKKIPMYMNNSEAYLTKCNAISGHSQA